jgi:hypothetical protein
MKECEGSLSIGAGFGRGFGSYFNYESPGGDIGLGDGGHGAEGNGHGDGTEYGDGCGGGLGAGLERSGDGRSPGS